MVAVTSNFSGGFRKCDHYTENYGRAFTGDFAVLSKFFGHGLSLSIA